MASEEPQPQFDSCSVDLICCHVRLKHCDIVASPFREWSALCNTMVEVKHTFCFYTGYASSDHGTRCIAGAIDTAQGILYR